MAKRPSNLLYRVRRRLLRSDQTLEGDRALLDRYAEKNDGDAFRELLDRHGALVLGACRRVLGDTDLAEDAFQATFLVLARNPRAVRGRGAIGPWLFTIARRLAQRVLLERVAERKREQKAVAARSTYATVDFAARELVTVLDDELEKLPDRLRSPLVVCYLQGRTQEDAARQLGQSLSTIRRRLEKGISLLRQRLKQRGATLEAALFATAIAPSVVAMVPPGLMHSTLCAAAHPTTNGPKSTAGHLAQEGLRMLNHDRSKLLAVLVLGLGLLAGAGFGLQRAMRSADPPEPAKMVQTPAASNEEVRQRLASLWQKQRETMNHGRFEVVRVSMAPEAWQEMRRDEFCKLVDGMNLNDVPAFLQKILDHFPVPQGVTRGPLEPEELRVDGRRRLDRGDSRGVSFCDDTVYVEHRSVNQQASICDAGLSVLHTDDLRYLPTVEGKHLGEGWQIQGRKNGRVKLQHSNASLIREIEADEETGFIYFSRLSGSPRGSTIDEVWQFGPIVDRAGRTMPAVRINVQFSDDKLLLLSFYHILKADLDATFTDTDFTVGVPAGTKVFDFRGQHDNPKYGFAQKAVPDVLAFVDAIPDKTRSIWPLLNYGTPAPALAPTVWLTRKGTVEPPNLKGKILLIDFWGTSCGPCIAELPVVQDAAKKYADSDLVLIGLHTAGTNAEEVTKFARKQGLTYLLGIDRSADGTDYFGATFKAFGIRGIPSAAVIDREGRVAFVGGFREGLQKAEELLNGTRNE